MQYMNGFQSLYKETSSTDQSITFSTPFFLNNPPILLTYIWVILEIQTGTITEYELLNGMNVMSKVHLLTFKRRNVICFI